MYDIHYKEISARLALLELNEDKASKRDISFAKKELEDIIAERERIERIQEFENAVIRKAITHFCNVSFSKDLLYTAIVAPASSGLISLNPDMIIYNPEDFVLDSRDWITKMNLKLENSEGTYLMIYDVQYNEPNDCYYIRFNCCPC